MDMVKHTPTSEKPPSSNPKTPGTYGSASSDRPYACPYEGCEKAYIHEYKLNLHLRREHPGHNAEENDKHAAEIDNDMDEGSDQDAYGAKSGSGKNPKRTKTQPVLKTIPPKNTQRKGVNVAPTNLNLMKPQWPPKEEDEEDSEETEEDREDVEERWRYAENTDDDEETEDEE